MCSALGWNETNTWLEAIQQGFIEVQNSPKEEVNQPHPQARLKLLRAEAVALGERRTQICRQA